VDVWKIESLVPILNQFNGPWASYMAIWQQPRILPGDKDVSRYQFGRSDSERRRRATLLKRRMCKKCLVRYPKGLRHPHLISTKRQITASESCLFQNSAFGNVYCGHIGLPLKYVVYYVSREL